MPLPELEGRGRIGHLDFPKFPLDLTVTFWVSLPRDAHDGSSSTLIPLLQTLLSQVLLERLKVFGDFIAKGSQL
jgi:hypothetical protein